MSQPQPVVSIASPMAVGPPSLMPVAAQQPNRSPNTIILIIVIIAIVVFVVFLFTKLNTQNKELKELRAEREAEREERAKMVKLIQALASEMGVEQDEKGEIQFKEDEEDEDEKEEGECEDENECENGKCGRETGRCEMGAQCEMKLPPDMVLRQPGGLFNMFGGGDPRVCSPVDITAVFQQMQMPSSKVVEEEASGVDGDSEKPKEKTEPTPSVPQTSENVSVD